MKHLKYIKPALIVGLLMLVVVGTTFALRTTGLKQITNTFDVGDLDTSIVEPEDPDQQPTNKDVTVTNNGSVSAYVRARIVVDVENGLLEPGKVQFKTESEAGVATPGTGEIWVILADKEEGKAEWQKDDADGYYYYEEILAPEGETGKLITEVRVGSGVTDSFDVIVQSESVPAFASSWSMDEAKAAFAAAASNSNS